MTVKTLPVKIEFDALDFRWADVPERKYENYMKMRDIQAAPDCLKVDGFPYMLQIEPTNLCNLKCPLCPAGTNQLERERRHMPLNEFRSIVDDMEDYLLFLVLWEWGEPFMHPELPEMIRYAADRDIKTLTSTNAHFLHDENYLERILTSGLSSLIVAIDSLEQDKYEIYRTQGKLSKAVEGLKNLVEMKKKLNSETVINLRMVIMKQNEHELPKMREFAREIGVDVFSVKSLNPSCGLDAEDSELVPANKKYRRYEYHEGTFDRVRVDTHCRKMWFMCNISANGEVIPCGYDFTSELKVGNINEAPLSQIWNSEEAVSLRKRLYFEKETLPKCRECTINFKLSAGGWFPEMINFNETRVNKCIEALQSRYDRSQYLQQALAPFPSIRKGLRKLRDFCMQ
jgi:radical SAM protein with 4Fe4S-binding SPASM domain